jgi:hypothetical protein
LLLPDPARRVDDPRVSAGPVVAALGNQADVVAVSFQPEAIAIVFDLMQPVRA